MVAACGAYCDDSLARDVVRTMALLWATISKLLCQTSSSFVREASARDPLDTRKESIRWTLSRGI